MADLHQNNLDLSLKRYTPNHTRAHLHPNVTLYYDNYNKGNTTVK